MQGLRPGSRWISCEQVGRAPAFPGIASLQAFNHCEPMDAVFLLFHVRSDDEYGDDAKLIGVYRTKENAEAAEERLTGRPGFVDHPDGWTIDCYVLDKDHWTEGFGIDETD